MKGTLISILVGALAGVLLMVASSVHASRAAANHAAPGTGIVTPAQTAAVPTPHPSESPVSPAEQAPLAK
jgi:hypothetical protein